MTPLFAMVGADSDVSSGSHPGATRLDCDQSCSHEGGTVGGIPMSCRNAYPRVRINLVKVHGAYRVQSCQAWGDDRLAHFLGSGEKYDSTIAAYREMKRRMMDFLWETGRTLTEREVNWEMVSE